MGDHVKKPAHELLLTHLAHHAEVVSRAETKEVGTIPLITSSAATTLILHIMHHMVIPDKHRGEIVEQLRKMSVECVNEPLSGFIIALADHLAQDEEIVT